jgi:hypothetical protein
VLQEQDLSAGEVTVVEVLDELSGLEGCTRRGCATGCRLNWSRISFFLSGFLRRGEGFGLV